MKSFSEIETTSKRASRAAGFSWGVSEEVGKNVRLLEMFGLPGVKNLIEYYNKKKEKNFENLKLINKENKINKNFFCPIILGTNFLDQIKSLESLEEIKFEKLAYPILFLPFIYTIQGRFSLKIFTCSSLGLPTFSLINLKDSMISSSVNFSIWLFNSGSIV